MSAHTFKPWVMALLGAVMAWGPAQASLVTLVGQDIDVVYDSTQIGSLFGTPTLLGNVLTFTPINFKAESLNGTGFVTADSTANVQIRPHAGQDITWISLTERGDYVLRGSDSFVGVTGQIRVFDLAAPLSEDTDRIEATAPMTQADGLSHNWTTQAQVQVLGNAQLAGARNVNLTVENLLEAYTSETEGGPLRAFVQKKFVADGVSITISTIPEPEVWSLGLFGLMFLAATAARRRPTPCTNLRP